MIVKGERLGRVSYIGKLDFDVFNQIYIGVSLDMPGVYVIPALKTMHLPLVCGLEVVIIITEMAKFISTCYLQLAIAMEVLRDVAIFNVL